MRRWRIALGTAGMLLGLFGVFRLVTQVPLGDDVVLGVWLVGAVVIHDGVLSPLIIGIGVLLSRVPPRARRYLQAALIVGAAVTVIALPMIYRRNSQPRQKAILLRNYSGNLAILLGIIAAVTLMLYAVRVARRDQTRRSPATPS
jgi:hypothetical protein